MFENTKVITRSHKTKENRQHNVRNPWQLLEKLLLRRNKDFVVLCCPLFCLHEIQRTKINLFCQYSSHYTGYSIKKNEEKKFAWLKFCYDLCIIYKVLYSDILLVNI